MNLETLIVEHHSQYSTLRLNRPDSYNSINTKMHQDFRAALKEIKAQRSRALLITGEGKGFCTGQDLKDRQQSPQKDRDTPSKPNLGDSLERNYNPLIRTIVDFPCPVICAVNGVAAGAGVSLALACDIVIASEQAYFIQSFSKIGLLPDSGATWILPRLIGHKRAASLMLLADPLDAKTAQEWGLIYKVCSQNALAEQAEALAQKVSSMPTESLKHIKLALKMSWNNSFSEQLDLERDIQTFLGNTEDFQEGVAAFIEKRTPTFQGK